ncbi:hypothetical protein [Microbacterium sp. Leaf436]|uniref:hypothetical protein n=1 Tax=Microbacterium sp. Leaf436 TaxID=1736377 RepID=UPI0006F959D5|nr:hypothetical protein [Microbacterium sp. Leaf436]KQT75660.1 hypothetical protein ASG45_04045 [Microbacterium sp. Leaf436]
MTTATENGWSLTVNDAITGRFRAHIESADSTWSTSIQGDGTSTETIVTNDADRPWEPGEIDSTFEGNSRLIVRWWGDTPVYAHKIDEYDYDLDAGKLKVQASDLIGEADWRLIDGVGADKFSALTVVNRSASGALRAILARMMQWGPDWEYPIDLPPDGAGDISATWEFWEKYRISDLIGQIEDRSNSELFLRVYSPGDRDIRFEAVVGAPIVRDRVSFKLHADETPLSGVKYRKSRRSQVTGIHGVGNGTGVDQETRWAGEPRGPIRDTKQTFPDLTGEALQQTVTRYYQANADPRAQWTVGSFTISDEYPPMLALPGTRWDIESIGRQPIPDGDHAMRVIKLSGGNGYELKTEVQDAAA